MVVCWCAGRWEFWGRGGSAGEEEGERENECSHAMQMLADTLG